MIRVVKSTSTAARWPGGRYTASVPATEKSWFENSGMEWVRKFREGGSEVYDSMGRLVRMVDPLGNQTTLIYTNDLLTGIRDAGGRELTLSYSGTLLTSLSGPSGVIATYRYASGRLASVDYPDATNASGYTFAYDADDQLLTVTDREQRIVEAHAYVDGKAVTSELSAGQERLEFAYEPGRTTTTDALGNTTTYEYAKFSGMNHLTKQTGPCSPCTAADVEEWTYTAQGRVETYKDRKGKLTRYTYNANGDVADSSPDVNFDYDSAGRLMLAQDAADTLSRAYDLAGQLRTETSTRNASTLSYEYFPTGSRQALKLNGATFLGYTYDDDSVLDTITRGTGVFDFGYDTAHRRTSLSYPNAISTSYGYNDRSLLTSIGATGVTQTGYTYDAVGNRITKTTPAFAEAYAYDALYRLTDVEWTGMAKTWAYGYDKVGNRITDQVDQSASTASYNEKNQLTAQTAGGSLRFRGTLDEPGTVTVAGLAARMLPQNTFEADVAATPGTQQVPVTAQDGNANVRTNLYQVTVPALDNSFIYDPNGNLTQKTDVSGTWRYGWDVENRLIRVCLNADPCTDAAALARFAYDALGRRVEKVAGATTTTYLYDGDDILQQTTAGVVTRHIHGPGVDEPLAQTDGSGTITGYFHADGLGSIVATTSAAGAVTATYRYDAYGNIEQGAPATYAYTGREWDPEPGLYYYRARYYDPRVGRFISEDPIGFDGGINLYASVGNNPLNLKDPSGEDWVSATANFIGGFGFGAAGTMAGSYLVGTATAAGTALSAVAAGGAATVGAAAGAVALVGYGAYQGTIALQEAVLGIDPYTGQPLTTEQRVDVAAGLAGGIAGGGAAWKLGTSPEFTFNNKNLRVAPFGNRTIGKGPQNRLLRELPHYHRRGIGPDGVTCEGQGIGRHRPLQGSRTDTSFWDRF